MGSRLIKRFYKSVFIALSALILLSCVLVILFHFNKDRIEAELLRIAHELQPGEIILGGLDLDLFAQFPQVSLRLSEVEYYEKHARDRATGEKPVLEVHHVYVSVDVIKLLRRTIEVSKVTLKQGEANILVYPDGSLNLFNALGLPGEPSSDSDTPEIRISDIDIKDIVVQVHDIQTSLQAHIHLKDVSSDIAHLEGEIDFRLNTELEILFFAAQDRKQLQNLYMEADLVFRFNTKTQIGQITRGVLDLGGIKVRLDGGFDLRNNGFLDLQLDASDQDMTLLSLLIEEEVLKYNQDILTSGNLFLNGSIKGEAFGALPDIELSFGAENIHLEIPDSDSAIEGLEFSGHLSTGRQPDLSQARFEITGLKARMPSGSLSGNLHVQNFKKPQMAIHWESRTDLAIVDKVFKLGKLESLSGVISVSAESDGEIDTASQNSFIGQGNARVTFSDVSIKGKSWESPIEKLNGILEYGASGLSLKNLSLQRGRSRLTISGGIQKLIYGLFDQNTDVTAHLLLESGEMHIGDALFFLNLSPAVSGLHLQNMTLDCSLQTPASVFSGFTCVPPGEIQIHHFQTELEGYPDIRKLSGRGKLVDDNSGAQVPLEKLEIELPFGKLDLTGSLEFPVSRPIILDVALRMNEFQLRRFETDATSEEPTPEGMQPPAPQAGFLDASMKLKSTFLQSPFSLGTIRISDADVVYHKLNGNDIILRDVKAYLKDIIQDRSASSGPLKSIASWAMDLQVGQIQTELIKDLGLSCIVDGQQDVWQFDFATDGLFGETEKGHFEIHFREQVPVYRLRYEIFDFDLKNLHEKTAGEGLLIGKLDILADLSTSGTTWQELLVNANGQIIQRGENLLLQSIDLDKILKNFKRSQRFNLADVGAFFFVGPAGLIATKGGDFARIAQKTPGDQTVIINFLSHCQINGGIIEARDVAFSTLKSRIALTGQVDFALRRIMGLTVAAVDKKGCILISQSVSGDFDDLQWGQVNVMGTLLGAVINVFELVVGDNCQPFYTGSVPHPQK